MKPEFVDNRNGNTLVAALRGHLDWLANTYTQPIELAIASGYFNPEGFGLLADRLERLPKARLLLGAEPTPPPARPSRRIGESLARFDDRVVHEAIRANDAGLLRDRNLLEFAPATEAAIRRLLALLESGTVEVRRYERGFLHGKAFIFADDEGVISGSSNFTAAGLTANLELNLGRYDPTPVRQVKQWFDDLWQEAEPFDLATIYAQRYEEYPSYLIYLRVLWELYGRELEEEQSSDPIIRLTTFQSDGLWRARRILGKYNGVLFADGVGLGKTFVAGELIREAVQDRRQRVLLISPAALRDGMWKRFSDDHQLYLENVSFEELINDRQLGGDGRYLCYRPNDYAMVVVDEAHVFRNPDTRRAQALRRLLLGKPPKQLVLLTATPVNNSLWDLYYLLTLFVGHDAVFAERGIRSLKERFGETARENPDDLRPDMLFDVLDAVTVRRTRHFVRRYYPNDHIHGPGGVEMAVQFPEPHVEALNYDLEDVLPGFFDQLKEALAPENGDQEPLLTMARYCPSIHRLDNTVEGSQLTLVGLIRSGLLKRFESSAYAFSLTAQRMADSHDAFLKALDAGYILSPKALEEWTSIDSDEEWERLLEETGAEPADRHDVKALKAAVKADRDILRRFADTAAKVKADNDPKLTELTAAVTKILHAAEKDGIGEEDTRDKRKIIIFSYFADTADWVEKHIRKLVEGQRKFATYRGRIVSVAGQESRGGVSREDAVFGFVPVSSDAPPARSEDRFDILISTDVLAEGVNLQQCRNIINYDLPWNPMRLVQRHGRIDRIGSRHADVYMWCFFPDRQLDELLNLEQRIRRKLAQAAGSIGVESEVIPGGPTSEVVFSQTRTEIESLRREDNDLLVNAGEDPLAHTGEEYRQELRRGLQIHGDAVKALAWGAGSGMAGGPAKGHFFCARVDNRVFLRFVPLDGSELVRNTLACLRMVTCAEDTQRHLSDDLVVTSFDAWAKARQDIYAEWMFATDPLNLQPRIRPFFRNAAEHLRKYPPTVIRQNELDLLVESIEAPWGVRHERAIREVFNPEVEDPYVASAALVERVRELGLQPFVQPEPLPPIQQDDVVLICWMGVDTE
ncbi:MAG: helicase-related protein [Pirellulaceae bacterium]